MAIRSIEDTNYFTSVSSISQYALTPTERMMVYFEKLDELMIVCDKLMFVANKKYVFLNIEIIYNIKETIEKVIDIIHFSIPISSREESDVKFKIHLINLSLLYGIFHILREVGGSLEMHEKDLLGIMISKMKTISKPVPLYIISNEP